LWYRADDIDFINLLKLDFNEYFNSAGYENFFRFSTFNTFYLRCDKQAFTVGKIHEFR